MLYAATAADVEQAGYKRGQDQQVAARLWAEAERLTGVTAVGVGS